MSTAKRSNIVFVFSDQQRYSVLGVNGNDVIRTPVLDAMAAEGLVCDNMYSNHPLCSPYRAILLTGRYGWQNLVIDNEYSPGRDIPTLPGTFHQHGYGTAHVGTWHLGKGPYPEEDRYGLDYLAAKDMGGSYFDSSYYENEAGPTRYEGWAPTVEADLAIGFMERHLDVRPDDPFALFRCTSRIWPMAGPIAMGGSGAGEGCEPSDGPMRAGLPTNGGRGFSIARQTLWRWSILRTQQKPGLPCKKWKNACIAGWRGREIRLNTADADLAVSLT